MPDRDGRWHDKKAGVVEKPNHVLGEDLARVPNVNTAGWGIGALGGELHTELVF